LSADKIIHESQAEGREIPLEQQQIPNREHTHFEGEEGSFGSES
jgi:hypothetical protein